MKTCPCCGRKMPEMRLGVAMTSLKARVFDLVKRQPGIGTSELTEQMGFRSDKTTQSHVFQINDALLDSGWRIVGKTHYGYRLVNKSVDNGTGGGYRARHAASERIPQQQARTDVRP